MIKVQIKNVASGKYTHGAQFDSNELAQAWLNKQLSKNPCPFGKPAHTIPAELDLDGNVLVPAVDVPSEFSVEILDISAQLNQEKVNTEALAFLAATDFMVLRHIRQNALGELPSLSEAEYLELERQRSEKAALIVR